MPIGAEFQAFILDLLAPLQPSARRMFGAVGIMRDGVMFALLAADRLYFRVDATSRPRFEAAGCDPFRYRRAGREVTIASYFAAPESLLDEPEEMLRWAAAALQAAQRNALARRRRPG